MLTFSIDVVTNQQTYLCSIRGGFGLHKSAEDFSKSFLELKEREESGISAPAKMNMDLTLHTSYSYQHIGDDHLKAAFSLYEISQNPIPKDSNIENGDICTYLEKKEFAPIFSEILGYLDNDLVPFLGFRIEPMPLSCFALNYPLTAIAKALYEQDYYETVSWSDVAQHILSNVSDDNKAKEAVSIIAQKFDGDAFIEGENAEFNPMALVHELMAYINIILMDCDGLGLRSSIDEIINNVVSSKADKVEKIILLLTENGALPPLQSDAF